MKKLYVLTRKDLSLQYAAVQAGHGLAQFMIEHPNSDWNNDYLIYLAVEDERELKKVLTKLRVIGIELSFFIEPDLDNQLTSIAAYGDGFNFSKFKLLAP